MKELVVCIDDRFCPLVGQSARDKQTPKKGEIYTVISSDEFMGKTYFTLQGFIDSYVADAFRPVDNTFGPAVCERIEEMIEYEEAVTV